MRAGSTIAFVIVAAVAIAALRTAAATGSVRHCGSLSVGLTATGRSTTKGAVCFLRAYRSQCRRAVYELARFGIDTVARYEFSLSRSEAGCVVVVTATDEIVPQKPHPTGGGRCSTLTTLGNDVVARGCGGHGIPSSISLTGRPRP